MIQGLPSPYRSQRPFQYFNVTRHRYPSEALASPVEAVAEGHILPQQKRETSKFELSRHGDKT